MVMGAMMRKREVQREREKSDAAMAGE